ncbi:MAG TPA: DUF929 family protein [Mycobacteriales bacterium]|nr:DUF929 family protein [Mycobacteriales bacterium]
MGRETNRSRRQGQAASAREKAAAARVEEERLRQRRRALTVIGVVVVLAIVAVIGAVVAINHKGKSGSATTASAAVVSRLTSVPASTISAVGAGGSGILAGGLPETIRGGQPLASAGKPTVLYIGAEFCPYCAAERWALIQALSRFGTFSGLEQIRSHEDDIATFTFLHARYTSKYLSFDPKEQEDQTGGKLQALTSFENAQFSKYVAPGSNGPGYPFLYFDGKYVSTSGMVDPGVLVGKTWSQISAALSDPTSAVAKAILGAANYITAAICTLTHDQPASACPASIQALSTSFTAYGAT